MFSFFKKKPKPVPVVEAPAPAFEVPPATAPAPSTAPQGGSLIGSALVTPIDIPVPSATPPERQKWIDKLKASLGKTASGISSVFGGSVIDEALYESLEDALLMADAGVPATQYLLTELRRKVKDSGVTHPVALKNILTQLLTTCCSRCKSRWSLASTNPPLSRWPGANAP